MSKVTKDRPRLGRGLSSLISVVAPPPVEVVPVSQHVGTSTTDSVAEANPVIATGPQELPLACIRPNPHQPRRQFSDASLNELAASLKSTGLIQPIIVRHVGQEYQLIAGERRWRAAQRAGLETVPAIVRDVDAPTQAQMALVENIQREDLNPVDRASAYRTLLDQLGLTQAELATRLGEDRSSIANHLRLLDLAEDVRAYIAHGKLSLGHAKVLAGVADPSEQKRLADLVVSQDLSVRNLERLIASSRAPLPDSSVNKTSTHLQSLEKSLARQLGLRVQVRTAASFKGKGKLVLHYSSLDQFDELLQRLGVQVED